jgi:1-acyl-sn-glycerol-3-phosphate acyltransferase
MAPIVRKLILYITRWAHRACLEKTTLHAHRLNMPGPFLIACTHISHLEATIVSGMIRRTVYWVAREEYFRQPGLGHFLRLFQSILVTRDKPSFAGIRQSIAHLKHGELVGIFPEGGVMRGRDAIFRSGPIKLGMCVIARRAGVPIVPVVVLGTEKLNAVEPWIPGACAKVAVIVGEPIYPTPSHAPLREQRRELGARVQASFISIYRELLDRTGIDAADVP